MLIHSLPGIEGNISTVLIVGNEDSLRAVLRTLFEECGGFDFCLEATSGSEAIDRARHLLPHLVILDSSLPEMNEGDSSLVCYNLKKYSGGQRRSPHIEVWGGSDSQLPRISSFPENACNSDSRLPIWLAHSAAGLSRFFRLRQAEANTAMPAPIRAAVEVSTFATASALCGSSFGGITDSTIVRAVQAKPIAARATATWRPPGT